MGLLQTPHFWFNTENLLHVVAQFVGDHVSLCELPGCVETLPQLIKETEIQIHLLIFRAVEGAYGILCQSTPGWISVPKEYQLGVPIWDVLFSRKHPGPVFLDIIEDEG